MKNIILTVSCLGVIQAFLLCIYLFSLKDKKANVFLALTLLGLTIRIGKSVFITHMNLDPWIRNLGIAWILVIGPALWFYGRALVEKNILLKKEYIHLAPFIVFVLFCWAIPNQGDIPSIIAYALVLLHLAVYLGLSWMYAMKQLKGARLFSWYRNIVAGVSIIWFVYVGIFAGFIPFYVLGAIFFTFLVYFFSYALLKRHVFVLEKYQTSMVDAHVSRQLLQQISDLFEKEEVYLNSELSLKDVAEKVSANPRDVSQVINETAQKNFAEFVNQYRIQKAKDLLTNPIYKQEKIASIAYDCGFGNVTSFNLAFKAETQLTPSQYRSQFSMA